MSTIPRIPKEGILSFNFHRRPGHYHKGIDFPAKVGTPVYAVEDGVIEHASNVYKPGFSDYGKIIVLKNENGLRFLYAHLNDVIVKEGDIVKDGDKIGEVGRTGYNKKDPERLITGSHLHFEVTNGKYPIDSQSEKKLNPAEWLELHEKHPFTSATATTNPRIEIDKLPKS